MSDLELVSGPTGEYRLLAVGRHLGVRSAGRVRRVLLKAFLDSSTPVVCEVSGVATFTPAGPTVFSAVLAAAGGWPAVRLALAGPPAPLAAFLDSVGISRRIKVFPDVPSAVAQLPGGWRPEIVARATPLPFSPRAARGARVTVVAFCDAVGCTEECAENAELVASELATNAVRHAIPPITLTLLANGDSLTISLSDGSPVPARLATPSTRGGRGLRLVDSLALAWENAAKDGTGKTVSARLRLDPV